MTVTSTFSLVRGIIDNREYSSQLTFSARTNDRFSCVCCSMVNVQDITMNIIQLRKTKAQRVLRLTKLNEMIRVEMDFA